MDMSLLQVTVILFYVVLSPLEYAGMDTRVSSQAIFVQDLSTQQDHFLCSTVLKISPRLKARTVQYAACRYVSFCQQSSMLPKQPPSLFGLSARDYLLYQTHLLSGLLVPLRHAVACHRPFRAWAWPGEI